MSQTPDEAPALDDVHDGDDFVGEDVEPDHDVDIDALEEEEEEDG